MHGQVRRWSNLLILCQTNEEPAIAFQQAATFSAGVQMLANDGMILRRNCAIHISGKAARSFAAIHRAPPRRLVAKGMARAVIGADGVEITRIFDGCVEGACACSLRRRASADSSA